MPIKRPKAAPLPKPFADQLVSEDDDARYRAILMKRELEQTGGFSWNQEEPTGFFARLRSQPRHKIFGGIFAVGMGMALIGGFLVAMDSGITIADRIVFVESWSGDRTSQDAMDDQKEAMDQLRAQVEANRRAYDAEQARLAAIQAERAAAQQATS